MRDHPSISSQKEGKNGFRRERPASPTPFFQETFEILSSRDAQGFAIDAPEQP